MSFNGYGVIGFITRHQTFGIFAGRVAMFSMLSFVTKIQRVLKTLQGVIMGNVFCNYNNANYYPKIGLERAREIILSLVLSLFWDL